MSVRLTIGGQTFPPEWRKGLIQGWIAEAGDFSHLRLEHRLPFFRVRRIEAAEAAPYRIKRFSD